MCEHKYTHTNVHPDADVDIFDTRAQKYVDTYLLFHPSSIVVYAPRFYHITLFLILDKTW